MEIRKGIYNIGIETEGFDTFDLSSERVRFNSYIVKGDKKTALIDTAPEEFAGELIKAAEAVSGIDYLILNSADPSHSGAAKEIIKCFPEVTVTATIAGLRNLREITNIKFKGQTAKDGMKTDLGGKTLEFIITPNLPWPDTMVTICPEEKTLFSCGMFSSAGDTGMKGYYTAKLARFRDFALNAVRRLVSYDIDVICAWMGSPARDRTAIDKYALWTSAEEKKQMSAAIVYASVYGCTKKMADTAAYELRRHGVNVIMINAAQADNSELSAINDADALIFGSPTINRDAPAHIWRAVARIDAIASSHKPCFVFGSYGWSGEALEILHRHLKCLRLDIHEKPFSCCFAPSDDDLKQLKRHMADFAKKNLSAVFCNKRI